MRVRQILILKPWCFQLCKCYFQLNISCSSPDVILLCIFMFFRAKKFASLPSCFASLCVCPHWCVQKWQSAVSECQEQGSQRWHYGGREPPADPHSAVLLTHRRLFFKEKKKNILAHIQILAVRRSLLLSNVIRLASAGLCLIPVCFQLYCGSITLMNPHQPQHRLHWDHAGTGVTTQTDFLQITEMIYGALPMD